MSCRHGAASAAASRACWAAARLLLGPRCPAIASSRLTPVRSSGGGRSTGHAMLLACARGQPQPRVDADDVGRGGLPAQRLPVGRARAAASASSAAPCGRPPAGRLRRPGWRRTRPVRPRRLRRARPLHPRRARRRSAARLLRLSSSVRLPLSHQRPTGRSRIGVGRVTVVVEAAASACWWCCISWGRATSCGRRRDSARAARRGHPGRTRRCGPRPSPWRHRRWPRRGSRSGSARRRPRPATPTRPGRFPTPLAPPAPGLLRPVRSGIRACAARRRGARVGRRR